MDISKLDILKLSNEGYDCVIKNPKTDTDTDLVIKIKGLYADKFKDESEIADTVEKTSALLSKFTVGWTNMAENGKEIIFSQKEAERIYLAYPLIRNQVLNAAYDVRNFIRD